MPTPIPALPFVDGEVMVAADVVAALEAVEATLNGGLDSDDLAFRAIPWTAIAAPRLQPYPVSTFDGELYLGTSRALPIPAQAAPMNDQDLMSADADASHACPTARQIPRASVFVAAVPKGDAAPVWPLVRRVDIDADDSIMSVEVNATIEVLADRYGAYSGREGNLDLRYRRVDGDSGAPGTSGYPATERKLDNRFRQHAVHITAQVPVDAGTYDVWVTYQSGGADPADVWQVLVLDGGIDIDVYKAGNT